MFFPMIQADSAPSIQPPSFSDNCFQEVADSIATEVIDVRGAYYNFFLCLSSRFPIFSSRLEIDVMSEAPPFFQKIHYDPTGYEIFPLFFAAAAQFLPEEEEVIASWHDLYRSMRLGDEEEIEKNYFEFIELATSAIKRARSSEHVSSSIAFTLIQKFADSFLLQSSLIDESRNYSFILKDGTYLIYNPSTESLESSGYPFHSDQDLAYQSAILLFFQEALPYPNSFTHSAWVDICRRECEYLFEHYEKIVRDAALDHIASEDTFIFSDEIPDSELNSIQLKDESFALTLLIRIAEYYKILPDLPEGEPLVAQVVERKEAAKNFTESFYFLMHLASQTHDVNFFHTKLNEFIELAIAFSGFVANDPFGPLKGVKMNHSFISLSSSGRTTSASISSFGTPSPFSPRRALSGISPLLTKRSSRGEVSSSDNSTPRAKFNPIGEGFPELYDNSGKKIDHLI